MKKITLLFSAVFLLFCYNGIAQTLNQTADWTNSSWTVTGTYTPAGLVNNPATDGSFTFDDDAAGETSLADKIQAESPVIDLTAAYTAGETFIVFSGAYTFRDYLDDILSLDYWDADTTSWVPFYTFPGDYAGNYDYQTCTGTVAFTTLNLSISTFTPTQLAGFKYRIAYDDNDDWQYGFCVTSATITSVTPPACNFVENPTVDNLSTTFIDFSWDVPLSGTPESYDWEIVPDGNGQGTGVVASGNVIAPTTNATTGNTLTANTPYDLFIRTNCGVNGDSGWLGPLSFTTLAGPPPANDLCSGAFSVTQQTDIDTAANAASTNSSVLYAINTTVPAESCGDFPAPGNAGDDVWFSFVAQSDEVTITVDSDFDSVITLYSGSDCGSLVYQTCSDDNFSSPYGEEITHSVTAGVTYYFRVYRYAPTSTFNPDFTVKVWTTSPNTLGIDDEVVNNNFTYYPNPVKQTLNLKAQSNIQNIAIYNMLGQEVLRTSPNTLNSEVNMNTLSNGAYFVKVTINDITKTVRIIKQ